MGHDGFVGVVSRFCAYRDSEHIEVVGPELCKRREVLVRPEDAKLNRLVRRDYYITLSLANVLP
jgi:hypothetical protein